MMLWTLLVDEGGETALEFGLFSGLVSIGLSVMLVVVASSGGGVSL